MTYGEMLVAQESVNQKTAEFRAQARHDALARRAAHTIALRVRVASALYALAQRLAPQLPVPDTNEGPYANV